MKTVDTVKNNNKKAVIKETNYRGFAIDFYENEVYTHSLYYPNGKLENVKEAANGYILDIFHPRKGLV